MYDSKAAAIKTQRGRIELLLMRRNNLLDLQSRERIKEIIDSYNVEISRVDYMLDNAINYLEREYSINISELWG